MLTRGVSPTIQDSWLKGPTPEPTYKFVPYSPSFDISIPEPFSLSQIKTIGRGLAGDPVQKRWREPLATGRDIQRTIWKVAKKHGIGVEQLIGQCRARHFVAARQEACYELHKMGLSYPAIGRRLGDRDHTTIIHGVRQHIKRMKAKSFLPEGWQT